MRQFRVEPAKPPAPGSEADRPTRGPRESPRWVGGPAFAPTGGELAAAGSEGAVAAWDVGGRVKRLLRGGEGPMIAVAYSPDGHALAAVGTDRTARLWDLRSGRRPDHARRPPRGLLQPRLPPRRPDAGHRGRRPAEGDPGPAGKMGRARGDGRTIRLWDPATGREIRSLRGHVGSVHALAFNPRGRPARLGRGRPDDPHLGPGLGRVVLTLEGHSGAVFALAFSPDGSQLASAGFDRDHPDLGRRLGPDDPDPGGAHQLGARPGVQPGRVAAGLGGRRPDGAALGPRPRAGGARLRGPGDRVHGVAFSPDGGRLAAASADGIVRVWEAGLP